MEVVIKLKNGKELTLGDVDKILVNTSDYDRPEYVISADDHGSLRIADFEGGHLDVSDQGWGFISIT